MLPCHACCVLSCRCCNGHSLLSSCCLTRIGRIENPSCSASGHPSQNISHLFLQSPAVGSLRYSLFGDTLSLYDLWSRLCGVSWHLGLHVVPPYPRSLERGRTTTTTKQIFPFLRQIIQQRKHGKMPSLK